MFSGESKSDFPKLPTFRQYCKSQSEIPQSKNFVIEKIWLPNLYPSVSLCSEVFLLRISSAESFYEELLEAIEEWEEISACPAIKVIDQEHFRWEINLLEGESATWEGMGSHGLKLTVNQRKSKRKQRSPKPKT